MIRVGVIGAAGRMGRMVCVAVSADPDLDLVVGIVRPGTELAPDLSDLPLSDSMEALRESGAEVAVDFTRPDAVMGNLRWAIANGIHMVVGTTGLSPDDLDEVERLLTQREGGSNVVVAPNFAIGAVLMQRFAEQAARFFPSAEIVELHHEGKLDAPSGTALATAERLARARTEAWKGPANETVPGVRGGDVEGIRIHSVRLPGLVAHQEVIFGGTGQTLTIRHDSPQRESFMPGVILAVKAVGSRPGLTVGLEPILGLSPLDPKP